MAKKYAFNFDEGSFADYKLLGLKGANLAQITQLDLPMPFGFTLSTDACKYYLKGDGNLSNDLLEQILRGLKSIEKKENKLYGDTTSPLLLSIRTGTSEVCRGLAKTIINVGINDEIASSLSKQVKNLNFAWECYSRFIKDYGVIVKKINERAFRNIELEIRKDNSGSPEPEILQKIIAQYKKLYRKEAKESFPQDVTEQLVESIKACFNSWNSDVAKNYRRAYNISDNLGCAISVQAMAFGNYDIASGVGVVHTRNIVNGEKQITGEMLRKAQEKSGLMSKYTYDMNELRTENNRVYTELVSACKKIEEFYQDMKSIEFCVESGKLFIMQVEDAPRSPLASVNVASSLVRERIINKQEAILKVDAEGVKSLMQKTLDPTRASASRVLAEGVCGYPGCATGVIALSASAALMYAGEGKEVIFIQEQFTPQDAEGIAVSSGLISLRTGFSTYAGVIARNKAIPCITACKRLSYNETTHAVKLGGLNYKEGDKITIDAQNAKVYGEALPLIEPEVDDELAVIVDWARAKRSINIYADADTPQQVKRGLQLGANGIGLVRTENMFYQVDRLNALRQFFLAPNQKVKDNALKLILKYQNADFIKLFEQCGENEITIRLIDATLNEFLPATQNELRTLARNMGVDFTEIKPIFNEMKQSNPILGIRGCRMLIMHPDFAKIQVQALTTAIIEAKRRFGKLPKVRILVPMVSLLPEFEILQRIITTTIDGILEHSRIKFNYEIGCMLETPRSCMIADKLAEIADFVCLGTNDLTQLSFGFSSDDCMKFLKDYYQDNLIYSDPFVTMDKNGVFELVKFAVDKIRSVKPKMPIWLLGSMDADTNSLRLATKLKIDNISCVPNKIPSATIAQAQAIILEKQALEAEQNE